MTDASSPTLVWFRRDLRLSDHPALTQAAACGPVICVFVLDPETEALGAAHLWRLERGLAALGDTLAARGQRLILRRGPALEVLWGLAAEVGARGVAWSRLYDAGSRARDEAVKAGLRAEGLAADSFNAALLHEPWTVRTGTGGCYKVYSPYWRAVEGREVPPPLPEPGSLPAPAAWPASDRLSDWGLSARMRRGAAVLAARVQVGEAVARDKLAAFLDGTVKRYPALRDRPDLQATSGLSDHLALGEISARQVWHAAAPLRPAEGATGFLKEIVWREFAHHLNFHAPEIETRNWRPEWDAFPWRGDGPDAERWRQGRTGVDAVDAAMRELYVTGKMHNRMRMLAASYLTKHLLTDWRVGEAWFRDCLIDWDPASNAMGWQWAAGSGPDAAPFFRIFNPETQGAKFDPQGAYRRRWLADLSPRPGADALAFFDAGPRAWALSPGDRRPAPVIDLKSGRERALTAYQTLREARAA